MSSPVRRFLARVPIIVSLYSLYKFRKRFRRQFLPSIQAFTNKVDGQAVDEGRKAIVFSPTVNPPIAFVFEFLYAMKLRERGVDAKVLMDPGLFGFPESISIDEKLRLKDFRRMIRYSRSKLKSNPHYLFTDEEIGMEVYKNAVGVARKMVESKEYMLEGIDLWPFVEASLVRYGKSALGHWNDFPHAEEMKFKYCVNAVWSLFIAKALVEKLKPSKVIISHGIYSTWGPLYQYLNQNSVNVLIYDFGWYKPDGMIFTHSGLIANGSDDGFFAERHSHISLEQAHGFVDEFMKKRLDGDSFDLYKAEPHNKTEFSLQWVLDKSAGKKLYGLFPNVLWDASNADTDAYFNNWVDWIIESVRYFSLTEGKALVIRAHPSEKDFMKARVTVEDVISKTFVKAIDDIPNIIFIPPNAKFRSYELFKHLEGGLVYNGTLGLEMIYHHIPVFVAGKAPYQAFDFVAKFDGKHGYFDALDNSQAVLSQQEKHLDQLVKYLYTYFWVNQSSIQFTTSFWSLPDSNLLDQVWGDPHLNYAMDTAVGKHKYFQDWVLGL